MLAPGLDCSTVSNVRFDPGPATAPTITCTDPGGPGQPTFTGSDVLSLLRVTWELAGDVPADEIAPGERFGILYDVTIPEPGRRVDRLPRHRPRAPLPAAHERHRCRGPGGADLYPKENVDPTVLPILQTGAGGPRRVVGEGALAAGGQDRRPPSITEQNNNTPNQATVGEVVTYRYSVVVPAETEVNSGTLGRRACPPASCRSHRPR